MIRRSAPRPFSLTAIAAAAGVALGIFALLFVLYNGHWIPLYLPTPPWRSDTVAVGLETRLNVLLAGSFAGGVVTVLALGALFSKRRYR